MAEQLKRAGSPPAPVRGRKPPERFSDDPEGPQHMTEMQRVGGTAKGAAGVQKRMAALKQRGAHDSAARASAVAARNTASFAALLALGVVAVGGWSNGLSGGLPGPVAGPVHGPLALHLPGALPLAPGAAAPMVVVANK
jgi:hypothetical protein